MKRGKVACRTGLRCTLLLEYGVEFRIHFAYNQAFEREDAKYEFKDIDTLFP